MNENLAGATPEIRELALLAREQGWEVGIRNAGHLFWKHPYLDHIETTSQTVSDSSIIKTIKNRLEKLGLITSRADWKRELKKRREIERLRQDIYSVANIRNKYGPLIGKPAPVGDGWDCLSQDTHVAIANLTDVQVDALSLYMAECRVRGKNGPLMDCPCGKKWDAVASVIPIAWHRAHCNRLAPSAIVAAQELEELVLEDPEPVAPPPTYPVPVDPEPDPVPETAIEPEPRPAVHAGGLTFVAPDSSDEDLWVFLEMILDKPILVNRHTMGAIDDWMRATRVLLEMSDG